MERTRYLHSQKNVGHTIVLGFQKVPLFMENSLEKTPFFRENEEIFLHEKHPFFRENEEISFHVTTLFIQ